jgi:hypothetical protein
MRTEYDLEMLQEMGFCNGIENYSRHLSGRSPGSNPFTLIDFFLKDFLLVIDESHATIPQIGGMYEGDRSRKTVLVEYGFRLPSALDNRPLNFPNSWPTRISSSTCVTPAEFEIKNSVVGNAAIFPQTSANRRRGIGSLCCRWGTTSVSPEFPKTDGTAPIPPISRTDQPPKNSMLALPACRLLSSKSFARRDCSTRKSRSNH